MKSRNLLGCLIANLLPIILLAQNCFGQEMKPLNLDYRPRIMATKNGRLGSPVSIEVQNILRETFGEELPQIEAQLWMAQQANAILSAQDLANLEKDLVTNTLSTDPKTTSKSAAEQFHDLQIMQQQQSTFIPLTLTSKETQGLIIAGAAGIVAFANDGQIDNWMKSHGQLGKAGKDAAKIGNGVAVVGPLIAGSYLVGVVLENDQIKDVGILAFDTYLAQGLAFTTAKILSGRARPSANVGPYSFNNNGRKDRNASFYSAHTASSFALATLVNEWTKQSYPWMPYVSYGAAMLTGYGRMHDRHHFASDVIVGGVAGVLITNLVIDSQNGNANHRGGLVILPRICESGRCVELGIDWRSPEREQICKENIEACIRKATSSLKGN